MNSLFRPFACAIALALTLLPAHAPAQTAQEAKDQAEIEKLKADAAASRANALKSQIEIQQAEEKARIELQGLRDKEEETKRKAISDAIGEVAKLKTESKDITVSGTPIETTVLTHRAVARTAPELVRQIKTSGACVDKGTVILADETFLGLLSGYDTGMLTLSNLATSYKMLVENTGEGFADLKSAHANQQRERSPTVVALLQGFAAVGTIFQTFRSTLTLSDKSVTVDALAAVGALASEWRKTCSTTVLTAYPNLAARYDNYDSAKHFSSLNESIGNAMILELGMARWIIARKAELAKEEAELAKELEAIKKIESTPTPKLDAKKPPPPAAGAAAPAANAAATPPVAGTGKPKMKRVSAARKKVAEDKKVALGAQKAAIAEVESLLANLKAADGRIEQAIQQLAASSEKQPLSPLAQLARMERFVHALRRDNSFVLTLRVIAGGGNLVTTTSFWRGQNVYYSGGAVLAFSVIKGSDGAYVGGGVLDGHEGYVQLRIEERSSLGSSSDPQPKPPAVEAWTTAPPR